MDRVMILCRMADMLINEARYSEDLMSRPYICFCIHSALPPR